ncbi:glycosyltransferase [Acetobacteraceae bacterium KSS8]|uniref:Glycosyltransferase n=1 Tax=Endosaccharibacter trunci TaxID=2812733 RepID=A0ABT1W9G9_9PROT|nr:glycosyltransferase [Acetobacteraceae bacterium KSS8]
MKHAAGWTALGLAALPLGIAAANLPLLRRPERASGRPALSVLIPARDEEANIDAAVRAVLANRGVEIELIVLDDGSTDRTAAILAAIDDPRLSVIAGKGSLPPGWSGKQHACARLAERASHELMVFVDADVRLAPDALSRLAGFMQADPSLGLASGVPHQTTIGAGEWLLLPLIHLLLLGYRPIWLDRTRRQPGFAAGCGQLFIARRSLYQAIGGHDSIRASKHDGLTLPRAFRRGGFPTGLLDATDLADCRMYQDWPTLWSGLGKNATEGMATPSALPIWTALLFGGHVLPFLLCLSRRTCTAPAAAAVLASLSLRGLLAARFRQDARSVASHPAGVLLLLWRQWTALFAARAGRPTEWRGRTYQS